MTERTAADYRQMWAELSGTAKDTLVCLCKHGPTWDGDVPSKSGRDELLSKGYAAKICMGDQWQKVQRGRLEQMSHAEEGYQAATYFGRRVWKNGYVEPRKDIVRMLVGDASQVRN